jgi:UDP-N-acetylmuramoyl-L-alanyl-D-glutamate--2,6-diaminopimelate ligase
MTAQARTIRLRELLDGMARIEDVIDRNIHGVAADSRVAVPGGLFIACAGARSHGLSHADEAVARGVVAIVYDEPPRDDTHWQKLPPDIALIHIAGLARRIGVIAARFHRQPSRDMQVIGITGTNGKTSCGQFLAQALHQDAPCGVIGTLGNGLYGDLAPTTHTTPDAVSLQAVFAGLRDQGARAVVMEVSSHALDQGRVDGIGFTGAVFTNLSHEHLDYHGDMAAYAAAKQRLFDMPGLRYAVINLDDRFGRRLIDVLDKDVQIIAYTVSDQPSSVQLPPVPTVTGRFTRIDVNGIELQVDTPWGNGVLRSPLLGRFNGANLLAVLGALLASGVPFDTALARVAASAAVPGRMERFGGRPGRPLVVVDYAHTPDALEQVLITLREHCATTLWCVFGCGGDRDRDKRPLMGRVAEQYADRIVLTDDNPRSEDGGTIIAQISAGMRDPAAVVIERQRPQAIAGAVRQAGGGDIVLVAGKGHEEYQLIGAQRIPYSDRAAVSALVQEAA